jgi:hypothetical protein
MGPARTEHGAEEGTGGEGGGEQAAAGPAAEAERGCRRFEQGQRSGHLQGVSGRGDEGVLRQVLSVAEQLGVADRQDAEQA